MRSVGSVLIAVLILIPVSAACGIAGNGLVGLADFALWHLLPMPWSRIVSTFVLVPLVSFYVAVPQARLLLRAFPARAAGNARWGCIVALGFLGLALGFGAPAYVIARAVEAGKTPPLISTLNHVASTICIVYIMSRTYASPRSALRRPFVLYLRRFASFSDRVLVRFLLRYLPDGVPLVMLISPHGGPRDWDPIVIGFEGSRLRRPVSSMPLVLTARDDTWVEAVRQLVATAECVIVDVSDVTPAVETELKLIATTDAWQKSIAIRDGGARSDAGESAVEAITYHRSVRAALPRSVITALIVVVLAVLTFWRRESFPGIMLWGLLLVLPSLFQSSLTSQSRDGIARAITTRLSLREQSRPT